MQTKPLIGGFVVLTLGLVGGTVYLSEDDVPILEDNQVVQEIKAEEADILIETVT